MKTRILFPMLFLAISLYSQSNIQQSLSVNGTGTAAAPSAQLDVSATNKGMLVPRMSSAQRVAVAAPADGLLVYDTGTDGFWYFDSTAWFNLSVHNRLADTDMDTRVRVEAAPDEDIIRFSVAGIDAMIIRQDGNVGIGTANPSVDLVVAGSAIVTASLSAGNAEMANGDFIANSLNGVINCGGSINVNSNVIGDVATPTQTVATGDEDLWIQGDLEVVGNGYKTGGGSWTTISDARLKKDIEPFADGLDKILQINPVRYRYSELARLPDGGKQYVGVLAQDILPVAPYMVNELPFGQVVQEDENGHEVVIKKGELYYTYDGSALTYILVNAVKEQQISMNRQEERVSRLENENTELKAELSAAKSQLEKITAALQAMGVELR